MLKEYPGLESTSANLLRSDLFFLLEKFLLLLLKPPLNTSALSVDEPLASLHLELTGMCQNSWVGDVFNLKVPATALDICTFPSPTPIWFTLVALITPSDLFLPFAVPLFVDERESQV